MSDMHPPTGDIVTLLRGIAEDETLPPRAKASGRMLAERLGNPIRVAVLGHPKSGKSQLLNLVAGERIVPDGIRIPTLELSWGERRSITLHACDGSAEPLADGGLDTFERTDIEMIRVTAPLPILKKITLLEVVSRGTAEDEKDGVLWASERADIAIWCSQDFTLAEQWLWSAMPDRLKDHGFLVLTKADRLIREGVLQDRIADLEEIVAEEFHSLVPVATKQGLAAQLGTDGVDAKAFAASGGRALVAAILRHVDQGRRADLDSALLLLSRFGRDLGSDGLAALDAAVPQRPAAPVPDLPETAGGVDVLRSAYDHLCRGAANLAGDLDPTDAEGALEGCVAIANEIADLLAEVELDGPYDLVRDDVLEAAEMLVLMQLEHGEGPAADAASLIVQLRRSFEQALAA